MLPAKLRPMDFRSIASHLISGRELESAQARELMRLMIAGEATEGQIGAALGALAAKGTTSRELADFATVVREHATEVLGGPPNLVDTCGTGGGAPSFNISTAAALVASAAGATIAKHGNRAVTSTCGSADVLEAFGVRLGLEPEKILHLLETVGLAFMFAPNHHPALKHVGKVRKELGFRTVFNLIGPLANPAGASRQLVGVYDPNLVRPMAEALASLGIDKAFVVHGDDGLDEISPVTSTRVARVESGTVQEEIWQPEDFGLEAIEPAACAEGGSLGENASILREAIGDPDSPRCAAVLPSAAAAIFLAGLESDLLKSQGRAREAVASGRAAEKLVQLAEASQAA